MNKLQTYARLHPRTAVAVAVAVVVLVLYLRRPMVSAANAAKLAAYPDATRHKFLALIGGMERLGYTVTITSTWRPEIAGEANIHSLWRAIDLNVTNTATGKVYNSKTSKEEWKATKIPTLAASLDFRWGGNFTTPYKYKGVTYAAYDPIHFDLGYPNNG